MKIFVCSFKHNTVFKTIIQKYTNEDISKIICHNGNVLQGNYSYGLVNQIYSLNVLYRSFFEYSVFFRFYF